MSQLKTDPEAIRKAKIEKWYRGDLAYKFHSGQKVLDHVYKDAPGQLVVFNVARQFGKSFFAVTKAIELATKNPKSRIKYATAFQTDLREFIIPTFEAVLEDGPLFLKPNYRSHGGKWVFPNGSEIKLVGLDLSPNGLRGNVIDMIVIDEAGFVDTLQYIYTSIIIPATLHRPNCKILMISTPPSTPAHPFMDFCQRAELTNSYSVLDIYANPRITEKDIERMAREVGGEDTTTFRREFLCEFITDSDLAIIPEWKDEYSLSLEPDEFYQYYQKYVGLDLGVKDNTAAVFGYYDFKRSSLVIESEFHMNGSNMNTEILANHIKAKEKEIWADAKPFRRVADSNWPLMIQDFTSLHDLTFISTSKDSLEAMINEVRIMVQNGQLIVSPKCPMLIGCLKYGVWNNKKTAFARSATYGHFDHLASLIYLVHNLARHTNPIPISHGYENHKAWMHNIKNQNTSKNSRLIKDVLIPRSLSKK